MTQCTFMAQNFGRNKFRAIKCYVLIGLCLTGLFLFSNEVLGAIPIFEDDFETYTTGQDLGAQVDWSCNFGSGFQPTISEDRAYSGVKSVKNFYVNSATISNCVRSEDIIATGGQQIWFYIGGGIQGDVVFRTHDFIKMKFEESTDTIKYFDENQAWQTLATFDEWDEWVVFSAEWKLVGELTEIRYSYNEGNWTDWLAGPYLLNAYQVKIEWHSKTTTGLLHFDTIEKLPDVCDSEHCWLCISFNTCIEADCWWYQSIYILEGYYCGEPPDPDPEECGPFFKCQYCLTQELCEAEAETCEWENKGYGERCYMFEPTIPPIQEEWEVPDLEDCGELSGVELWLCEIKNFIAGVFMPSQEKITALYQTIGAFKDRFPFNYVGRLKTFFIEIEESIDEEKAIPFKILEQEGIVSFDFWEEETTIGGVAESFKNILFDFTTFIVLLGFFVWLISLFKRFF